MNKQTDGTAVLLFGPQALGFQEQAFHNLRSDIHCNPENAWMQTVVAELPQYSKDFSRKLTKLRESAAPPLLQSLAEWLNSDGPFPVSGDLPNALLTPLVVLGQLTQYTQYVKAANFEAGLGLDRWSPQPGRITLGFCTGLLSALVVSAASSKAEFERLGSVAIRLATMVGALVDAEDQRGPHGLSKSLSVAWSTPEHKKELDTVLKIFPEAYISVYYDENRVTVTTSASSTSALQQRLKKSGMVAVEIGLRGRFHAGAHQEDIDAAISLCESIPELQLPDASEIVIPTCSTASGQPIQEGKLHHIALREMLSEPCRWRQAFEAMAASHLKSKNSIVVSFGSEKCVPPSFSRLVNDRIIHMDNWEEAAPRISSLSAPDTAYSDEDIAVVGMSCKVAGADDPEELWDLMCRAESQHIEVPEERFTFDTHWRETDPKRKWYGNFLRDHDAFDHKFFKKSPREASSQDPQQRLFLQAAYQAVEQSGYFNSMEADTRVGVFVGVCAADYEANVACYPANAFTATGNLKSFIAGKISHYFGWTGPGLTIDTACSASAVAIHQGCRAILAGECTAALAGGVTVMTSPLWFQNLAGASFLSPTGPCKPFDSKADGYCRGEGIACVFLKKMSQAIKDGDPIIGSIRSTAVYQNENCTPIFVPNAPSLSRLFGDVVHKARLQPKDITLVEAHGTGTPVGDPAEYESIKRVFGGRAVRSTPMPIGSIKGLIGHTEATSGVIALIKVLLLLQKAMIPPQASFKTLNPAIHATAEDMLEVVTRTTPWNAEHRVALINNYGASGSNASMVVAQSPILANAGAPLHEDSVRQPFWIPALDERSLREYCIHLRNYIKSKIAMADTKVSLANLSYNQARQSNRNLPLGLIFRCQSIQELDEKLTECIDGKATDALITKKAARPVILCFGGQISRTIGLERKLYESATLLREHLDDCNAILESLGLDSFYPEIFDKATIEDTVKLQSMLFALQYSSAMSWIDCGVPVAAIVGHSFGELTAQCISGQLSLRDSLRVVIARAQLVKDYWGSDSGAMMAIEADLTDVQILLNKAAVACPAEPPATIACYNGPRSFTIAGSTRAMAAVEQVANTDTRVRGKMLFVSNAFHSTLVEPLKDSLKKVAHGMRFGEPSLRWERATEAHTPPKITPEFFATHMRDPVYANHAFQRLHKEYPSAIWLEAGSNSTITNMANKALGSPSTSHFQAVNLSSESSLQMMADVSVSLWKEGLKTHHWFHHPVQAPSYQLLLLPPYQFEKHRHWLELKKPQKAIEQPVAQPPAQQEQLPTELYSFVGYQDDAKRQARFRINTMIKKYEKLVRGHVVAETAAICPATVEVDIAIEALLNLRPDFQAAGLRPEIHNVENQAALCINPARVVWLDTQATSADFRTWNWQIISTDTKSSTTTLHVRGQIIFRSVDDVQLNAEFTRYERLVGHRRCLDVLNCSDPDDTIQGRNMYKVFAEIVEYDTPYHGLQKLVGKGDTSAGRVVKNQSAETWLDPHLSDCFSQVGGFWVNCMTDRPDTDMYIAAGFESWIRSPRAKGPVDNASQSSTWHVMASHHKVSEKAYTTDIFIFDGATGSLHEVILGINYARIPKAAMRKTLLRLTAAGETTEAAAVSTAASIPPPPASISTGSTQIAPTIPVPPAMLSEALTKSASQPPQNPATTNASTGPKILGTVAEILAELSGLEIDTIKLKTNLADIGIDSLMGMEMAHELEGSFKCTLDTDQLAEVMTVQHVVDCVAAALGVSASGDADAVHNDQVSEPSGTDTPGSTDCASSVTTVSDHEPTSPKQAGELQLSASTVLEAFGESKLLTDEIIADHHCAGYMDNINPKQTQLCIALILDAFEQLGCPIKSARPGQILERIRHVPQHGRLVKYLYEVLETDARLVDIDGERITRTAVSAPAKSSKEIVDSLVAAYPDHNFASRLAYYCGSRLSDVLLGKLDGVKLIFGSDEGRELVSGLYGDSLLNKLSYKQMEDILKRLVAKLPPESGPLKILEMGAGTGGTTKYLVPLLAELNVPVEYTFTDLAPSFVAAARKKYKAYPFMKFRPHDIEKEPAEDLIGTQHLVVASNAVHATHSLATSAKNIRKALRPDGFLMMLEMTETLRWVDIIFGLLEGWWLFEDERPHALSHQSHWERELYSVGYGHVDWTDGQLPETRIQRIIIAMASGPRHERLPVREQRISQSITSDTAGRAGAVEAYVRRYTSGFVPPSSAVPIQATLPTARCVLVTGATGSLGSHLVAHLAAMPEVATVICLNRMKRGSEPTARQHKAFADHRNHVDADHLSKLRVYESDSSKPRLGLTSDEYTGLLGKVTHIVHNAWPMSGNRPISGFEAQFQVMRNLIDFSRDISASTGRITTFQFISSISVVGHQPLHSGSALVQEDRVGIDSVLPNGYSDAKFACECMLDATLHAHPQHFHAMSVRLGQVAGNSKTGYWNLQEHLSFLIKSSQTLRALPDFEGQLSWTPVDLVAATSSDLLLRSDGAPDPIYHIDNPVRQPWKAAIPVLADALNIPVKNIVPFSDWVRRVRCFPGSVDKDNPAFRLVDFLDGNFLRMSCGGLLLNTIKSRAHSPTLAAVGPVSDEVMQRYIRYWQEIGFLSA